MRLLFVLALAGCATTPRVQPRADDPAWRAIELDSRSEARDALRAWLHVASTTHDDALAQLALSRADALYAEGVANRAALHDVGAVPERARTALVHMRAREARMAGDESGARALEREMGCGLPWQPGATLGPLARLDLARPLDDATFVSPARATLRTRGCRALVVTAEGRSAAIPLGLELDVAHPTTAQLTIDTDQPYRVWLDGLATPMPDDRAPTIRRRTFRVKLPAGRHRLAVVVAVPLGRLELGLELDARDVPILGASGAHFVARSGEVAVDPQPRSREPGVAAYVDAALALANGDTLRSRAAIPKLNAQSTSPALLLAAQLLAEDATVPSRIARDRGRRLAEKALALDPSAVRARDLLGRLALDRDRVRDAVEIARAPDLHVVRAALLAADTLRARNRDEEVRPLLEAARDEGQCALIDAFLADDRARHRPIDLARAEKAARCRPGTTTFADALHTVGELDRAIDEYRRIVAIDPFAESARASLADVLLERDRTDEAVGVLRELVAAARRTATYRLRLVDALRASGKTTEADAALREGITLDPESAELDAAQRARDEERGRPYATDRIDGRAVITAFEAAHARYEGPAVFVLDRAVTRIFATGGQRTITHNIVKVLTKEGIDRWGEWTLPENAELLGLCAWKPDGSRLEPEQIAEKDSISLPGLDAGDYVEIEYVERSGPAAAFHDGFLGERFFFASFDAPLDRSEYVLVSPHGLAIDLDSRGAPPMVLTSRTEQGGEVDLRTFAGRGYPQRVNEPSSAPAAEYLPSVRASSHVTTAAWRDFLRDLAWGSRRADPELETLARSLVAGVYDDRERLARLDRWVRRNVKQGGGIEESATAVLARREGSRAMILCALAEAVGLPARLVLARSRRAAQLDVELESYDQLLVEIAGVIDDPHTRHGRPGELQPQLRGASALLLDAGPVQTVLSAPATDARQLAVRMSLAADGSGTVSVEEHLTGWPAIEWRDSLALLAPDRVRQQFEQRSLAAFFPGATLDKLSWDAAEDDDRPFVVRYSLAAPGLAHREGAALVLPVPFAGDLSRRFATGAPRVSPLYIDEVAPTTLELEVTLFPGGELVPAPPTHRDTDVGRFSQSSSLSGGVLHLRSSFYMPLQRLPAAMADALLDWTGVVDRAEAAAARVTKK